MLQRSLLYLFVFLQVSATCGFHAALVANSQSSLLYAATTALVDQQRQSSIVENCFDAFNQRDLDAVMDCFEETVSYEDTIFEGGATNKKELRARFQRAMETFPPKVIVDEIASCPTSGKVGARWHLEIDNFSGSNTPLPFSKGCSFYTTNLKTGLIETGFRVMETPLKPDDAIFNLLMVPTKVMERLSPSPASSRIDDDKNEPEEFPSIIDKAYWRWNKRDMNGAVECFSDNMYLEDTLYLKPIQGKEALRKHYARIAEQVPSICKIVLDDIAQDPVNGNIAARWHLEVKNDDNNDINLLEGWSRGCSMYTTDPDTGLIRSGLDVTESPVKVNEAGLNLLLSPLQLLKR